MRSEHALEGVRRGRPSHSMEMRSGVIRCLIRLGRDTCSDLVSEVNKALQGTRLSPSLDKLVGRAAIW